MGLLYRRDAFKRTLALESADIRAALRAEESKLAMELVTANLQIGRATAISVRDGKANGEIDKALVDVDKAVERYLNFTRAIVAKQVTE